MRPGPYNIPMDKNGKWLLAVDEFYKKVEGGHWVNIKVEDGGSRDRRRSEHRSRCDCCGNRMLRTLFPILKDSKVYWVGCECLTELQRRGLKTSLDVIEVKEESNDN